MLSFVSPEFRNAKKSYLSMVKSSTYRKNRALKNIDLLISYKKIYPQLQSEKYEIENDTKISNLLKKDFKGIDTNTQTIEDISNYIVSINKKLNKNTINEFLNNKNLLKNIGLNK